MEGWWIKLYTSLTSWEWYDDIPTCRLYIHLLLTVNIQDKQWHGMVIKRGSRVTSLSKLAEETGLSVKQVRRALEVLERTNNVTSERTNKWSVITVVGYEVAQDDTRNKGMLDGTPEDKQRAIKGQTKGNQRATTKEYKNIRIKDKDIYIGADDALLDAIKAFEEMRKRKKKPMTDRAKSMFWNRLKKLASYPDGTLNQELAVEIVDNATMHCWDTVYELKGQSQTQTGGLAYTMDMFD